MVLENYPATKYKMYLGKGGVAIINLEAVTDDFLAKWYTHFECSEFNFDVNFSKNLPLHHRIIFGINLSAVSNLYNRFM